MLDKTNIIIECASYYDFIDRLICNNFTFEIDLENHRIYIPSYQYKEKTWNDVGFHYYGSLQYYYTTIDDINDVSDIVSDAVDTMKNYIKKEIGKKLKDIMVNHLGIKEKEE